MGLREKLEAYIAELTERENKTWQNVADAEGNDVFELASSLICADELKSIIKDLNKILEGSKEA